MGNGAVMASNIRVQGSRCLCFGPNVWCHAASQRSPTEPSPESRRDLSEVMQPASGRAAVNSGSPNPEAVPLTSQGSSHGQDDLCWGQKGLAESWVCWDVRGSVKSRRVSRPP